MSSKWRILLSVLVIILLAVAVGFYFIFSQKGPDNKSEIITGPAIQEKVPQEEEAIRHEREERGDAPPPWGNRMFLR